jgi:single-stranded-DNA-specific exonuclease
VIFYVLMALRARLRSLGRYETQPQPNIGELLDLVALGSVADVVPLDANNRILVHQGLERIRAGRARPGSRRFSKWPAATTGASPPPTWVSSSAHG